MLSPEPSFRGPGGEPKLNERKLTMCRFRHLLDGSIHGVFSPICCLLA